MAKSRKGQDWQPVDTESLPKDVKAAFDKFAKAYAQQIEAKNAFNDLAANAARKSGLVPEGKVPAFNYTGTTLMMALLDSADVQASRKPKINFQLGR